MFMAVAFLLGSAVLGVGIVNQTVILRRSLSHAEQILWGLVSGWIVTTLGAYLIARFAGRLSFGPLVAFTLVIWVVALLLLWRALRIPRPNLSIKNLWRGEYACLALVLFLFAPFYIKLFASHM